MIITFANSKGGCGKTTSAIQFSEILSREYNKNILLIDIDHQANLSSYYLDKNKIEKANILTYLQKKTTLKKSTFLIHKNLSIIPSSLKMTRFDSIFSEVPGKELLLQSMIKYDTDNFDYIIIDTHPDMATPQKSALIMSDYIIAPIIAADEWNIDGLDLLLLEIKDLQNSTLCEHVKIKKVFALPTQCNNFSIADWKELKQLKTIFPECEILPEIKYIASTKHYFKKKNFEINSLYKNYKKTIEVFYDV